LFVVTFNPEWAAKNPEKAKAAANAYRERERQIKERSDQFAELSSDERKQVLENARRNLSRTRKFRRIKKVSRRLRSFFSRKG